MKIFKILFLIVLVGCIETDFEEPIPEVFRISNSIRDITFRADSSYHLATEFFNDSGRLVSIPATWTSSNPSIVTMDGNVATCHQSGFVLLIAEAEGFTDEIVIEVFDKDQEVVVIEERTGQLQGVGGYTITGTISLFENEKGEVILNIENYTPDGPGPYFYISNESQSVVNAVNLEEAKTPGDYEINLSDFNSETTINSYNYVVVWCEPFGIPLGFGQFEN